MQRLKAFISRHRVTLMIIPTTDKSIKQVKFNIGIGLIALCCLSLFNIALFSTTLYKIDQAKHLNAENGTLSENLLITTDRINALSSMNVSNQTRIEKLEETLSRSSTYMKSQLEALDKTNAYVSQLVTLFNTETNSTLKAPVSRSYNRSKANTSKAIAPETDILDEIETIILEDEITAVFSAQNDDYKSLIDDLKTRLSYLDRRPDFYPTTGKLSSGFGYRTDPITGYSALHNGIDICNKIGTPIHAAGAGIVTFARYNGNFGNVIIVDHGNGYETAYAHCNSFVVKEGESVEKGQTIAEIGRSGRTTGPHLHFELRYLGTPVNPFKTLNTQ